jgi:hypothetical protein
MALLVGGTLLSRPVLAEFNQASAAVRNGAEWTPEFIPIEYASLLPELVDTIIPATDTPGAKEALAHIFIDIYVRDCYPDSQQNAFLKGLAFVDEASQKNTGHPFIESSKDERLRLLTAMEKDSWANHESFDRSFIRMSKQLTLLGFYSSKLGATRAATYESSPGPFEGCIDLKPGQKADVMS